jgi:quinol monooxygenase YgiN
MPPHIPSRAVLWVHVRCCTHNQQIPLGLALLAVGRALNRLPGEAKPGKQDELQKFLTDVHAGIDQEPLTGPWFALRYSETTFAVFEAFPDAEARHVHDMGPGGRNFLRSDLLAEILAYPAQLYRLDVLHGKYNVIFGQNVSPA